MTRSNLEPSATSPAEGEIRREFREFRESAVRLAERVRDLSESEPDPLAAARADLHLVRSIFGKWSSDVLVALHALPSAGFEELRRSLHGISPRVLSLKLKELEQNGMVQREILDSRPPRVRYSLTERGWTVAWLSQPVLLYLRFTDHTPTVRPIAGDLARPERTGKGVGRVPAGFRDLAGADREPLEEDTPLRTATRRVRNPIGRSRVETVAL
ncbi:MAG: helix-turn-helix transcriptional regulator [Thermoplasmata archaeon]|nr:helix-turn-helix transcriptional regulator [Thermoplasmata archaeon]